MENSAGLPPIYADTPIELAPAKVITSFPVNTFLENLAIASDGTIFVTNHEIGTIVRITPDGNQQIYASLEGKVRFLPPPTGVVPANIVQLEVGKPGYHTAIA